MTECLWPDCCVKGVLKEHLAIVIEDGTEHSRDTGDLRIKVVWVNDRRMKPQHEATVGKDEDGARNDLDLESSDYEVLCQAILTQRDIDYAAHRT